MTRASPRWALRKDRSKLNVEQRQDLDSLVAQYTTNRVARAWLYREQLRDILDRKQPNVVHSMLRQWCTNVMRSKVEPMKEVAMPPSCVATSTASWPGRERGRPMDSSKRSMDCFKRQSGRPAATRDLKRCARYYS
jgi:hypothetical protein